MAEKIETGGTAFPMQDPVAIHAYAIARIAHMGGEPDEERERAYVAARAEALGGMTLRDYFAAKAMQSYLLDKDRDSFTFEQWANAAYEMADAMLEAREEQ